MGAGGFGEAAAGEGLLDFAGELEFFFVDEVAALEFFGEGGGLLAGLDEFGDVAGDAEGAFDAAVAVAPGEFGGDDPGFVFGEPGFLFEFVGDGLSGADDFLFVGGGGAGVFFVEEVAVVFADEVVAGGDAVPVGHALVGHDDAGFEVFEVDLEGDVVDEVAEEEAFFLDLGFGVFASADVDHGAGDAFCDALAIADDSAADAEPAPGAAAGEDACVDGEGFGSAGGEGLGDGAFDGGAFVGVDAVEGWEDEVGGAAVAAFEEFEDAAGVVDLGLVGVPVPDAFVGGAEGEFEPLVFQLAGFGGGGGLWGHCGKGGGWGRG